MNDWMKILAGTVLGFIAGVAIEPFKLYFQKRHTLSQMEYSIYREMAKNFQNLVGLVHTIRLNNNPALDLRLGSAQISRDRLDQLRTDPLFDQIPHRDAIVINYASYARLVELGSRADEMEIADAIIFQTEQYLTTGQLKKRLFFKFLERRLQRRIRRSVSCAQPFPNQRNG